MQKMQNKSEGKCEITRGIKKAGGGVWSFPAVAADHNHSSSFTENEDSNGLTM